MKSIQLMLLGFLACFFGPLSFGLVEQAPIGGGTSDSTDTPDQPPADPNPDNNISAEEVEDPLPPDEKKSDDSDEEIPQEAEDVRPIGCGASEPVAEESESSGAVA